MFTPPIFLKPLTFGAGNFSNLVGVSAPRASRSPGDVAASATPVPASTPRASRRLTPSPSNLLIRFPPIVARPCATRQAPRRCLPIASAVEFLLNQLEGHVVRIEDDDFLSGDVRLEEIRRTYVGELLPDLRRDAGELRGGHIHAVADVLIHA